MNPKMILLLSFIAILTGCERSPEIPSRHVSAESLLHSYVLTQSNPKQIKRLCYRPETVETFGQDWDEFIESTSMANLTVKDSTLEEFQDSDEPMAEMTHNGIVARGAPTPIGYLRVNFEDRNGFTGRYVRVPYGKHAGAYYICTWQKIEPAE